MIATSPRDLAQIRHSVRDVGRARPGVTYTYDSPPASCEDTRWWEKKRTDTYLREIQGLARPVTMCPALRMRDRAADVAVAPQAVNNWCSK